MTSDVIKSKTRVSAIAKTKDFLSPDPAWELSFWGRLSQGRRELAVLLRRDVTAEKLAELIGATGPTMTGWKRGSQPKKKKLEALEKLFREAGLGQYTARYLDWGPSLPEPEVNLERAGGKPARIRKEG